MLLFSVTAKDCDWQYLARGGKGGQKQNKTSSAVRCMHRSSGAAGFAHDHREQRKNRELAFTRMVSTDRFKVWHRIETARRSAGYVPAVDLSMKPENLKIEYFTPAGEAK